MKRFKTKQEFEKNGMIMNPNFRYCYGLPFNEKLEPGKSFEVYSELTKGNAEWCVTPSDITSDPHPFDSMDIKVRVTPKQSKKLQKKAFKMGYVWHGDTKGKIFIIDTGKILLHKDRKILQDSYKDNGDNYTELTYRQFMNGTVPKKKKKFKVGDCVEVVGFDAFLDGHNPTKHYLKKGEVCIVRQSEKYEDCDSISTEGEQGYGGWFPASNFKHTTKRPEEKLMFKEWEVKAGCGQVIQIGCKSFDRSELKTALHVMNEVSPHADLKEFHQWLNEEKKLGI